MLSLGTNDVPWKIVYSEEGYKTTSDERLKDIVSSLDERYEEMFMKLKPILYRWKDTKNMGEFVHSGFGAQTTLHAAIDSGISEEELALVGHADFGRILKDGRKDGYYMAYEELHALEVHMIQKQAAEIQQLRKEIEELKNK